MSFVRWVEVGLFCLQSWTSDANFFGRHIDTCDVISWTHVAELFRNCIAFLRDAFIFENFKAKIGFCSASFSKDIKEYLIR